MSQLIFRKYGGSYQLRIQDAQDLEKIQVLDEVHWACTSITTDSLNCDDAFISYVDTDKNGRIRPGELKAAQSWLFRILADRSRLVERSDVLRLNDIDMHHDEGQKLRATAEVILNNLNIPNAPEISLDQVRNVQSIMASSANNGDGIIPPEATHDPDLAQFIETVMDTVGSALDACGKPGISEEQLKDFFDEAETYLTWKAKGEIPQKQDTTEVMPWGAETSQAYELVVSLNGKIEQFFTQCAMVMFDERTVAQMQFFRQKELEEIDFTDKSVMEDRLKDWPLALPNPEGILDLEGMINPLYMDRLLVLKENVLRRALESPAKYLTEKEWGKVKSIFLAYRTWLESKQELKVEKLGVDHLRNYLNGSYRERASELIAKDLAVADELNQIHNLEKLILYQRGLIELANNFVSFESLYNPKDRALFEMGTLIIDGRQISFTMKVQDRQGHKKISEHSYMYLLYVEVTGRQSNDIKFEIVAPVTSGSADGLRIGKRGIFFTIDDREWDAEIVDIVINPISPWESVKAPFQQFTNMVKKQIDKFTKLRQDKLESTLSAPSASGIARDLLLGGGLAIAALGSAFAYITKTLSQVNPVSVLVALLGLVAVVLLPSIMIGYAKIRKRDMGLLLEAMGWAVNIRMRLSAGLGQLFTRIPPLPKSARKEKKDAVVQFVKEFGYTSFRSRKKTTIVLITILIALCLIWLLMGFPGLKSLFQYF